MREAARHAVQRLLEEEDQTAEDWMEKTIRQTRKGTGRDRGGEYTFLERESDGAQMRMYKDGTVRWYNKDGQKHSFGDQPGTILPTGARYWYKNGVTHREGGPAKVHSTGHQYWYRNGKLHREDGPAVEYPNDEGSLEWWLDGEELFTKEEHARRTQNR